MIALLNPVCLVGFPVGRCQPLVPIVRVIMTAVIGALVFPQGGSKYLVNGIIVILQRVILLLGDSESPVVIASALIGNPSGQFVRLQAVLVDLKAAAVVVGADNVLPLIASPAVPLLSETDGISSRLCGQCHSGVVLIFPAQRSVFGSFRSLFIDGGDHHLFGPVNPVMLIKEVVKGLLVLPHIFGLLLCDHIGSVGQIGG